MNKFIIFLVTPVIAVFLTPLLLYKLPLKVRVDESIFTLSNTDVFIATAAWLTWLAIIVFTIVFKNNFDVSGTTNNFQYKRIFYVLCAFVIPLAITHQLIQLPVFIENYVHIVASMSVILASMGIVLYKNGIKEKLLILLVVVNLLLSLVLPSILGFINQTAINILILIFTLSVLKLSVKKYTLILVVSISIIITGLATKSIARTYLYQGAFNRISAKTNEQIVQEFKESNKNISIRQCIANLDHSFNREIQALYFMKTTLYGRAKQEDISGRSPLYIKAIGTLRNNNNPAFEKISPELDQLNRNEKDRIRIYKAVESNTAEEFILFMRKYNSNEARGYEKSIVSLLNSSIKIRPDNSLKLSEDVNWKEYFEKLGLNNLNISRSDIAGLYENGDVFGKDLTAAFYWYLWSVSDGNNIDNERLFYIIKKGEAGLGVRTALDSAAYCYFALIDECRNAMPRFLYIQKYNKIPIGVDDRLMSHCNSEIVNKAEFEKNNSLDNILQSDIADLRQYDPNYTNSRLYFISDLSPIAYYYLAKVSHRLNSLSNLAYVVQMTPAKTPYSKFTTYNTLLTFWIPRILWENKPRDTTGVYFGLKYKYSKNVDEAFAWTMPTVIESWMVLGWTGIFISGLILGLVLRLILYLISRYVSSIYEKLIYSATILLNTAHFATSSMGIVLPGIVQSIVLTVLLIITIKLFLKKYMP